MAHSIIDMAPIGNGLEAWRRLVHSFDTAPAHANLSLVGNILEPPKGKVANITSLVEKWEKRVRHQDERSGQQALTDDTQTAILMDTCTVKLDRHLALKSDRFDAYPNVGPAIRDYVGQLRHKRETRWMWGDEVA